MACARIRFLRGVPIAAAFPMGLCAFVLGMILFGVLLIIASRIITLLRSVDG